MDYRGRFDGAVVLARKLAQQEADPAAEPNAGIRWLAQDRGFGDAQIAELHEFAVGALEWAVASKGRRTAAKITELTTGDSWGLFLHRGDTDDAPQLYSRDEKPFGWLHRSLAHSGADLRWIFPEEPSSIPEVWITALERMKQASIPLIAQWFHGINNVTDEEAGVIAGLYGEAGDWEGTFEEALQAARGILRSPSADPLNGEAAPG